jgi:hypothetical protein
VTILVVLGIWFVGSCLLGLLVAHVLRFSEASREPKHVFGHSGEFGDAVDDKSDLVRSVIGNRE